ncbi:hypothetical protein Fcan01_01327 [Folsomia candida]|uniref:Uncharacterized protein n=1 Tax=Folsomia candida TaxID=158441 RepID=A0A226EX97_FOLCA|nr:hypothetical protein Fcan01_01327 [Folsomia candida]
MQLHCFVNKIIISIVFIITYNELRLPIVCAYPEPEPGSNYKSLGHYNTDPYITISGISAGGAFSMMLAFIHSSFIKGAGIFAGAPFPIALVALEKFWNFGNFSAMTTWTDYLAHKGWIDDPYKNMRSNLGAFIYHGSADQIVPKFCACGYAGIYDMFSFLYQDKYIAPTYEPGTSGHLFKFNQDEFFDFGSAKKHGFYPHGYAYVPFRCRPETGIKCRLHFAFQGCSQSLADLWVFKKPPSFIQETGYLEVADANDIIMVFPLSWIDPKNVGFNFVGCFDIYSHTDPFRIKFATRWGYQPLAVKRMFAVKTIIIVPAENVSFEINWESPYNNEKMCPGSNRVTHDCILLTVLLIAFNWPNENTMNLHQSSPKNCLDTNTPNKKDAEEEPLNFCTNIRLHLLTCGKWFLSGIVTYNMCIYYFKPTSLSWENAGVSVLVQCAIWGTIFVVQLLSELIKIEEWVEGRNFEGDTAYTFWKFTNTFRLPLNDNDATSFRKIIKCTAQLRLNWEEVDDEVDDKLEEAKDEENILEGERKINSALSHSSPFYGNEEDLSRILRFVKKSLDDHMIEMIDSV